MDGFQSKHANYNWDFVAHVIRDVFPLQSEVIYYGKDHSFIDVLRSQEHGIEAWGLYTRDVINTTSFSHQWRIDVNDSFFGFNYCDLLISFDYAPRLLYANSTEVSLQIARLLKRRGIVFLVNPGSWADDMSNVLKPRPDLVDEIRSFSMFRYKDVMVLENDL